MDEVARAALGWLVPAALSGLTGWALATARGLRGRVERESEERRRRNRAHDEMMVALGKAQLRSLHQQYVVSGRGCPVWVKDDAESVYMAYHALGGNGTGTHLYQEIMAAPVDPGQEGD